MNDWQRVRKALGWMGSLGFLAECTCDSSFVNWGDDECGHCQIDAALQALNRLEAVHVHRKYDGPGRREAIVAFVDRYWQEKQYGPSLREIADSMGMVLGSSLMYHVKKLEDTGRIVRAAGVSRSIRVVAGGESPGVG